MAARTKPEEAKRKKVVRDSVLSLKITPGLHEAFNVVSAMQNTKKTEALTDQLIKFVIENDTTGIYREKVLAEVSEAKRNEFLSWLAKQPGRKGSK